MTTSASRRRFLQVSLGCLAGSAAPLQLSGAAPARWFTTSRNALGSRVTIKVSHESEDQARRALQRTFDAIEQIEGIMSIYRQDSELSQLNRTNSLENPSPQLVDILRLARTISRRSRGAFDVSVQPLWELFREADSEGRLPTRAAIESARSRVNWRTIKIDNQRITLAPDSQITLNGIAQGYATDLALNTLKTHGIEHALIDCGELGTLGSNPDQSPWRVGVQHPREEDAFVGVTELGTRCLATSGDYETHFSSDYRHHHIFDPRRGISPTELASASVVAPTAALADALSTTLLVLGAEQGIALAKTFPKVDAMLITKSGEQVTTTNFPLT
jgi:FAD:protein FMN transferase